MAKELNRRNVYYPNSDRELFDKGSGQIDQLAFMWTKATGISHTFSKVMRMFVRYSLKHLEDFK
jgi:hypothetical protein